MPPTCARSPLPSLAASIQLWGSRLGRVMCSMANCLLLMKVRRVWERVSQKPCGAPGPCEEGPRGEREALREQSAQWH